MTNLIFSITPFDTSPIRYADPFVAPAWKLLEATVFGLHAIAPLSKLVWAQQQADPPDQHQFQIFTQDARAWIEGVEFYDALPGYALLADPIRIGEWSAKEYALIVRLRGAAMDFHNQLNEPSLIQFVLAGPGTVLLTPSPLTVLHGTANSLTVAWHSPNAGHLDWIALYAVGAPNADNGQFFYVPDAQVDGTFTFNAPASPGSYELRYLVANSYTDVARSVAIIVT